MECVYLIRDNESGLHKIGMSKNWERRASQLKVGTITTKVRIVPCRNSEKWEKVLHSMFNHKRLPQSEWFRITAEEAIPKMEWLASQTNQRMVIGNWHQAEAGHYYRRRKSRYDNWYTETKSAAQHRSDLNAQLEQTINYTEQEKRRAARVEPGYWPTKEDKNKVEWAEKDPTYISPTIGCITWGALIFAMLYFLAAANVWAFLMTACAAWFFKNLNN